MVFAQVIEWPLPRQFCMESGGVLIMLTHAAEITNFQGTTGWNRLISYHKAQLELGCLKCPFPPGSLHCMVATA